PASTLLPYPTLFRSQETWHGRSVPRRLGRAHRPAVVLGFVEVVRRGLAQGQLVGLHQARLLGLPAVADDRRRGLLGQLAGQRIEDRKSTRLNSSHVK